MNHLWKKRHILLHCVRPPYALDEPRKTREKSEMIARNWRKKNNKTVDLKLSSDINCLVSVDVCWHITIAIIADEIEKYGSVRTKLNGAQKEKSGPTPTTDIGKHDNKMTQLYRYGYNTLTLAHLTNNKVKLNGSNYYCYLLFYALVSSPVIWGCVWAGGSAGKRKRTQALLCWLLNAVNTKCVCVRG